jgi:hypothetical protein
MLLICIIMSYQYMRISILFSMNKLHDDSNLVFDGNHWNGERGLTFIWCINTFEPCSVKRGYNACA